MSKFFVSQHAPRVLRRGEQKLDDEGNVIAESLHVPICDVSEYLEDRQAAAELIATALNEKYEKEGWS